MNTRKIIHKVYLAWDFKKEELWLNEMAAEGWVWSMQRFARTPSCAVSRANTSSAWR